MSHYYHVVPWYNTKEWHKAYELLYSEASSLQDKQEALNMLITWKARCPLLPSGVESTLGLLEVHITDTSDSCDQNEQIIRLAYSSAVMRFVNHMLDNVIVKGSSLYQAAKTLSVPDWIIDLRHDTAHSNKLPSIELLREATVIGLEWLQKHYWDKHKECLQDFVSGQVVETTVGEDNKISALISLCMSLGVCSHNKLKFKNLSGIPDASLQESIINDARELFGDLVDFSNLKTVSILSLVKMLDTHSKKFLNVQNKHLVNHVLLGEDSLILSFELLNSMGHREFQKNVLGKSYVKCFEVLLSFLHSNELLQDFILELINLSSATDKDSSRSKLAALWVSEIFKALKKCKQFQSKINKSNAKDLKSKKKKDLLALYHHWYPNEKHNVFLLDVLKQVPEDFTDINFIRPILTTYNPNTTYFVKDLLHLVDPPLPKAVSESICKLAKLVSSPDNLANTFTKIYSVEDLKHSQDNLSADESSDLDCVELSFDTEMEHIDNVEVNTIWKLASSDHNWSNCPIGAVPWHQLHNEAMEVN